MTTSANRMATPRFSGRGISAIEFLVGAAIVVAHNVFHVVPNEVPILFVIGVLSIRIREGGWSAIGLGRPKSWAKTIAVALLVAVVVIAVGQFVFTVTGVPAAL